MSTSIFNLNHVKGTNRSNIARVNCIDRGNYRVAAGFKFRSEATPIMVGHVTSQLLADVQQYLIENLNQSEVESINGTAFFNFDFRSGTNQSILIWKDHPCFATEISGARGDVMEAVLTSLLSRFYVTGEPPIDAPTVEFVLVAKDFISDRQVQLLDTYLISGDYLCEVGREYLN